MQDSRKWNAALIKLKNNYLIYKTNKADVKNPVVKGIVS